MLPRGVRLRNTSTSSIESLPSEEIAQPNGRDVVWYNTFDNIFSQLIMTGGSEEWALTCPLTRFMMQGKTRTFNLLILIGQRLRTKRYLEFSNYYRTIAEEYDENNGIAYNQHIFINHNDPNDMQNAILHNDNGRDRLGENAQDGRLATNTIRWYEKSDGYRYGTRAQDSYNEVISFLTKFDHETERSLRSDMISCYQVYWEVIPLPYVRIQQLDDMLETEWGMRCTDLFRTRIGMMLTTYENIFPNLAFGDIQPRSLKHLCRCEIRKVLWRNRNVANPDRLDFSTLNLTESLVKYLKIIE